MPSPLAPDSIRVQSCVCCLFWTNGNSIAVTSFFLSFYLIIQLEIWMLNSELSVNGNIYFNWNYSVMLACVAFCPGYSLLLPSHPGLLTRVSSIRFHLFEIKLVLVYNSTPFYLTDLYFLYFFIQNAYGDKKYLRRKAKKLCLMNQIVIESHRFLEYWQNR